MHVVIPPLENSSRFGNRFEFERCTNVSRINSFHLSKTTSFRTRRYLFRALERYWMMMNEMLYIYFFIRSKAWTYRSYVIVNYHPNIRLSLTTVVRLATLCIQKKKKRKENTQKRKKKKNPNPTSIHARQVFVKPFLDNAVKRNFQIPFQQRGGETRL